MAEDSAEAVRRGNILLHSQQVRKDGFTRASTAYHMHAGHALWDVDRTKYLFVALSRPDSW